MVLISDLWQKLPCQAFDDAIKAMFLEGASSIVSWQLEDKCCWWFRHPASTSWYGESTWIYHIYHYVQGFSTISGGYIAGFLKHQQYQKMGSGTDRYKLSYGAPITPARGNAGTSESMPFFDPCVVLHGGTNLGYSPKGTHMFHLTVLGELLSRWLRSRTQPDIQRAGSWVKPLAKHHGSQAVTSSVWWFAIYIYSGILY